MKRKYIDRDVVTCAPVVCETTLLRLDGDISGYASLVRMVKAERRGYISTGEGMMCIADTGYERLLFLPDGGHFCMTAMYAKNRRIIEWYFDMTRINFVDENGTPCYDDLYLDVALMPDGRIVTLDEDELLAALTCGEITRADFDLAYRTYKELLDTKTLSREFLDPFCEGLFSLF